MTEEFVSKSERKRQATRQQELGKELASLKRQQLEAMDLPDHLSRAIFDYQRFSSHEARRRQLQFIGKVMRDVDTSSIEQALATFRGESSDARYRVHLAEEWRDRLIAEPETLTAFLDEFPQADRQALRHALQRARKPAAEHEQKAAMRALFRVIRDQVPESDADHPA